MSSKSILVLGATGPSGVDFCNQALKAGHSLIIFARTPSKLPPNIKDSPKVSIIQGEFADPGAREKAAKSGADVLATFMGPVKMPDGAPYGAFYQEFLPQIIKYGIKRAMVLTTPSFPQPQDKGGLKWSASVAVVKLIGGSAYHEMIAIGDTVSAISTDTLRWTLFRVGWLNNGPAQPVKATYTGSGEDTLGISRASIAQWVVEEITAEKFVGKAPYICN